jgi:hypothetical protein
MGKLAVETVLAQVRIVRGLEGCSAAGSAWRQQPARETVGRNTGAP